MRGMIRTDFLVIDRLTVRVDELEAEVATKAACIAQLETENAVLKAQLQDGDEESLNDAFARAIHRATRARFGA